MGNPFRQQIKDFLEEADKYWRVVAVVRKQKKSGRVGQMTNRNLCDNNKRVESIINDGRQKQFPLTEFC